MRIIVTGGAGFIGSHLVEALLERGEEVAVIDDFNAFYAPGLKRENIEALRRRGPLTLFEADIRDRKGMDEAFASLNLLEASRKTGVKNFVFASSSSVYGINSKVPFSEEDPITCPISPYATTKRAGELMCFTYSHLYNIPVTCLRFFTVYGEKGRPDMAVAKFTRLIHEGRPVEVYGDGTAQRDFTYVSDIVKG